MIVLLIHLFSLDIIGAVCLFVIQSIILIAYKNSKNARQHAAQSIQCLKEVPCWDKTSCRIANIVKQLTLDYNRPFLACGSLLRHIAVVGIGPVIYTCT